jgi:hypothetical protein
MALKFRGPVEACIRRREAKRREEFINDILKFIDDQSKAGYVITLPDYFKPNAANDPRLSHEKFKEFEQWFADELRRKLHATYTPARGPVVGAHRVPVIGSHRVESQVEKVYNSLADKSKQHYAEKKTTTKLGKYRTQPYVPTGRGNVYALSGVPILTQQDTENLISKSRIALNA